MAYLNGGFWAAHFREVFVRQVRAFARALEARVLPAFEGIEAEAEQIAEEEYQRLGSMPGDGSVDMGDLADYAQEAGSAHYEELSDVRQAILNLAAAALFHLLEQQLLLF